MNHSITILYVEDDPSLSFITRYNLEKRGYAVIPCEDGNKALEVFSETDIALCLLDVMLPGMDGFTLAGHIRNFNKNVPIIFLTVKSLLEDKLVGLKCGGDDYLTKPFSMEELILKMEIFLKRSKVHPLKALPVSIGNFKFDFENLHLFNKSSNYHLTFKEAMLLQFLFERKNNVIKRDAILTKLWGSDDYFLGRSLDVFISRLRKYFGKDGGIKIENIHGVGFRMVVE